MSTNKPSDELLDMLAQLAEDEKLEFKSVTSLYGENANAAMHGLYASKTEKSGKE